MNCASETSSSTRRDEAFREQFSKPIRRPALKHVLKTYCPPIPEEENEAATTPPAEQPSQQRPSGQGSRLQTRGHSNVNNAIAPITVVATQAVTEKKKDSPGISPKS